MFEGNISGSTTKMMDGFEASDEKYMKIIQTPNFIYNHNRYCVNFIISKISVYGSCETYDSGFTMSDFKHLYNKTSRFELDYINKEINPDEIWYIPNISVRVYSFLIVFKESFLNNIKKIESNERIMFDKCFPLYAQSKDNRHYGEVDDYYIVGYLLGKCEKSWVYRGTLYSQFS